MLRFFHAADLHLGWRPSYLPSSKQEIRLRERDSLIEKICKAVIDGERKIDGLIIAGDLFEKHNPEDSLVSKVIGLLERVVDAGKLLITVPGNHDEITYNESVYRKNGHRWPGILVKNPEPAKIYEMEIRGSRVSFYSLAYTGGITKPGSSMIFPKAEGKGYHVGIFHGSLDWDGLPDRSLPLKSEAIFDAGYDYTALGHIHIPWEKNREKQKIAYCGAGEFKSFNDPGWGHQLIVNLSESGAFTEKEKIETRNSKVVEMDISALSDFRDLIAQCKKLRDSRLMIRFSFRGTPPFILDEETFLGELEEDFFYTEVENTAVHFSPEYLETLSKEPTLRGLYAKRMGEYIKSAQNDDKALLYQRALLKGLEAVKRGDGK